MSRVKTNGIEIEFETFGKTEDRPILLIMGLGSQMVGWPDEFCVKLADRGHYVIRFDNRDVGLSAKMNNLPIPNIFKMIEQVQSGQGASPPYTLSDMAGDTAGLLDALGINKAHICGISMGGMIAQIFAIEHPERVLSLISIASTTGEPDLPPPAPEAVNMLFSQPPMEREAYIQYFTNVFEIWAAGSQKFDKTVQREISSRSFDRGVYPPGFIRQFAAIMSAKGRRQALASLTLPALVIHGPKDPLVPFEHGKDTANAIPGAKLKAIDGLGHGLAYPNLWDEIVDAISDQTSRF